MMCDKCMNNILVVNDLQARVIKNEKIINEIIKKHNGLCKDVRLSGRLSGICGILGGVAGLLMLSMIKNQRTEIDILKIKIKTLTEMLDEHLDNVEEGELDERGD